MYYEEGSETPYLTEEIFIHNVFEPDAGKVDILLYKKSVSANGIDYTLLVKDRTEGYSVYHSFQAYNESDIVKDEPVVITEEEYKAVLNEVYKVYYNIEMLPIQVTDITGVSKKTISMNSNTIMTLEIIFNGKYNGDDSVNSVNFNYNTDKIHNMKNFTKSGMLLREVKYTYPGNLVTSPREIDMSVFNKHMHTWVDATCTTPKTCFTCQAVDGDPLGHKDENSDKICDVCHEYCGIAWSGNSSSLPEVIDGVITISSADELAALSKAVSEGNDMKGITIYLNSNISLNGFKWIPIGTTDIEFRGIFDGQGYTIFDMTVEQNEFTGLFGRVGWDAQLKNINLKNVTIKSSHYAGGLVGWIQSCDNNHRTVVENCHIKNFKVECISDGTFEADGKSVNGDKAGGLIGYCVRTDIRNCSVTEGSIFAARDAGQVIGHLNSNSIIDNITKAQDTLVFDNNEIQNIENNDNIKNSIVGRQ